MEKGNYIPYKFEINFDPNSFIQTEDPTLKIGKARVFYKHLNRNGSYITEQFAEKLALSAYMKPIVGTYDHSIQDFKGHEAKEEAKGYGFVIPGSLKWERNTDPDGIARTYATYDVIIWAKYWEEANKIFTKNQSMELDRDTIVGEWMTVCFEGEEEYAFVYSDGVIAGLCVLGDNHPPCFEGASFFSTSEDSYKEFSMAIKKYFDNGGKDAMEEKVISAEPLMEETAPVEENPAEEIPAEENPVEETPAEEAPVEETPAEEAPIVEEIPVENEVEEQEPEAGPNYEAMYNELLEKYNSLSTDYNNLFADHENLKQESQLKYDSLLAEKNAAEEQIKTAQGTINEYERQEKDRILARFMKCLPADIMRDFEENKEQYSVKDLTTQLSLQYTSFSMAKELNEEVRVPQAPQENFSALAQILNNYKK